MKAFIMVLTVMSTLLFAPLDALDASGEPAADTASGSAVGDSASIGRPEADRVVLASVKTIERLHQGDDRVRPEVLRQAAAIAVFPRIDAVSGGGVFNGDGILVARRAEGWSLPVFVNYSVENGEPSSLRSASDGLILVFKHTENVRQLAEGFDFILGSDATVAAGSGIPVQTAQIVAYAPQSATLDESVLQGAAITLQSGPLGEYYRLNQDAVREYFGEEEQLIRQFLGLDQEINSNAQGIDNVPESATLLQQKLNDLPGGE